MNVYEQLNASSQALQATIEQLMESLTTLPPKQIVKALVMYREAICANTCSES